MGSQPSPRYYKDGNGLKPRWRLFFRSPLWYLWLKSPRWFVTWRVRRLDRLRNRRVHRKRYADSDCDTFTIKVRMKKRWTPHFLAMLHTMEHYGNLGCSRTLSFYSDGDGDFRPTFEWPDRLSHKVAPRLDKGGDRFWDAG